MMKKMKKTMIAFAITIIILIASVTVLSEYHSSVHPRDALTPPYNISYNISGSITVDDDERYVDLQNSNASLECIYTDRDEIISKLHLNVVLGNSESCDMYDLHLNKYNSAPIGSKRIENTILGGPEDIINPDYSMYIFEENGAEFEFHIYEPDMRIMNIFCRYDSLLLNETLGDKIGQFNIRLSVITYPQSGIPIEGKAVGPWEYSLKDSQNEELKSTLKIDCVSSARIADGDYLLLDKDVSKYCRVSLINDGGSVIVSTYARFYPSGVMDTDFTNINGKLYRIFDEKIGNICANNRYEFGNITILMETESEDPFNTEILSIQVKYALTEVTYDDNGNITSEVTQSANYGWGAP